MNRLFTIGVGVYIVFALIMDHGYYKKEKPHVTVDPVLSDEVLPFPARAGACTYVPAPSRVCTLRTEKMGQDCAKTALRTRACAKRRMCRALPFVLCTSTAAVLRLSLRCCSSLLRRI